MNNSIKILFILLATSWLLSCKNDNILVTYPKSYPVFEEALVGESIITFGDSVSINLVISDEITPLSTLELKVVVNNEVVASEAIRTKGNNSTVYRKYLVPFVANRPDNTPVKFYLSSINVDGYTTDTIISSTIGKRPVINDIWFVPTKGSTYKLDLVDAEKLIYKKEGMIFGNSVTYRLATKIDKFKKVDWSGLVFGQVGDGIGVIPESGDPIISTDETLVGISNVTFDALKFTVEVGGKLLTPATTLDIYNDLAPVLMGGTSFLGGNIYFGKDVEVTFTGLSDLSNSLPPDFFEITGTNTAKFLGNNAIYKAYYYEGGKYLYVEPLPDVIYPEALWVCGTGFGRPSSPFEITSSWNWNSPFDYAPARLVSDGVYQVTFYGKNTDEEADGFGSLDFKFFFRRGWWDAAHEIDAAQYNVTPPFFGRTDEGNTGNVNAGGVEFEGVIRVTLNQNTQTITIENL